MNEKAFEFLLKIPELLIKTVDIAILRDNIKEAGKFIKFLLSRCRNLTQVCENYRNMDKEKDGLITDLKAEIIEIKQKLAKLENKD